MDDFGVDIPHPPASVSTDFANKGMAHEMRQLIVRMRSLYQYNNSIISE